MKKKTVNVIAFFAVLILMTGCHGYYNHNDAQGDAGVIAAYNSEEEKGGKGEKTGIDNADSTSDADIGERGDAADINGEKTDKSEQHNEANAAANDDYLYTDEEKDKLYEVFDGALFIGDSRTEGLQLYAGIKKADFFCAKGMTIDKINDGEKVLFGSGTEVSVYDVLDGKEYSRVYIGLGLNELGMKYIDDYVEEYNSLIATVKAKQPAAEIYVQALLPVTHGKSESHEYVNNAQIYWYNTHILEIAENNDVTYVNADAPLVNENGELVDEATTDGVHMNKEYCKKWAAELARLTP